MAPKLNGDTHHILDLNILKLFLQVQKVCMENVRLVLAFLLPRDFLVFTDIRDAYMYIPIFLQHQRCVLQWVTSNTNWLLLHLACPWHLKFSPRYSLQFWLCTTPTDAPYLDDLLLKNQFPLSLMGSILQSFRWILKLRKSSLDL